MPFLDKGEEVGDVQRRWNKFYTARVRSESLLRYRATARSALSMVMSPPEHPIFAPFPPACSAHMGRGGARGGNSTAR